MFTIKLTTNVRLRLRGYHKSCRKIMSSSYVSYNSNILLDLRTLIWTSFDWLPATPQLLIEPSMANDFSSFTFNIGCLARFE